MERTLEVSEVFGLMKTGEKLYWKYMSAVRAIEHHGNGLRIPLKNPSVS